MTQGAASSAGTALYAIMGCFHFIGAANIIGRAQPPIEAKVDGPMSRLASALEAGEFVVTTELNPPKGTSLAPLFAKAETLRSRVHAFNLTDSHTARMTMSPFAVAHLLLDRGFEPILQVTCRDRNRLALQADLLGAHVLGTENVLCMTGDDPTVGDHPQAKPVFDLEAIGLLKAIDSLRSGTDASGNALKSLPAFYAGAVVNPGAPDLDKELRRMEEKIEAGASFFQTQAVYDPVSFERFMQAADRHGVPIIAGFIMLKSGNMARRFNKVPGIDIPVTMIEELDRADDKRGKSAETASRAIGKIAPMCQGVHIIAVGWESLIPDVLDDAGISKPRAMPIEGSAGFA